MTRTRFAEIKEMLGAAWARDNEADPIDLFDGRRLTEIPRPAYDAARAVLSAEERAEYDAIIWEGK